MTDDIGIGTEPESGPWEDEHPDTDAIDELKQHCAEMGISYSEVSDATGWPGLVLYLLCSDNTKRAVVVPDKTSLEEYLKVPLDRYKFVAGYQAIYSSRDGFLEAALDYEDSRGFYSRLFGEPEVEAFVRGQFDSLSLRIDAGLDGTVEISPMSESLRLLTQSHGHRERVNGLWMWELNSPSIKIRGYRAEDDTAIPGILERMAIDILMQIDVKTGRSVGLTPANPINATSLPPFTSNHAVEAPNYVYDLDAFRLYIRAGMVNDSPTISYLSYYHVIEYYIMRTHEDAESKISLSTIDKNKKYYGKEKDLVIQVMSKSTPVDELRKFLKNDNLRLKYLIRKGALSSVPLNVNGSNENLLEAVAKRIYKLRCRIVHSKSASSDDRGPLFPFSSEVKELGHDLELIRYVARNVLIANRKPR